MKIDELKVLLFDDEDNILKSIRRGLMEEPYQQFYAASGEEGLRILKENDIGLLVTDMRMPGMDGLELLKLAQEISPDTIRIILTGYSQISTILNAINQGQVFRYLTKPWKLESDFIPAIRQGLEYYLIKLDRDQMIEKLKSKNIELNKQNLKVYSLLKEMEKSNQRKDQIFNYLSQGIIPFISDVVDFSNEIVSGNSNMPAGMVKDELKKISEEGLKNFQLLKKVEALLKES
jgi:response regulator RpfG family c-di-GMP phosphodiesterase